MQVNVPTSQNGFNVGAFNPSAASSDGVSNVFEVLLTHEQFKLLQKLFPVGYSLNVSNKNSVKRQPRPGPSKEVSTEQKVSLSQQKISRKPVIFSEKGEDQDYPQSNFVKNAENILKSLMAHRSSIPFLHPVDYKALRIPDYPTIVKEPMDLSTVQKKLNSGLYATMADFERDIRLIWSNAFLYNPVGTQVHKLTEEMNRYFDKIMTQVKDTSEWTAAPKKNFKEAVSKNEDKPVASSQVTKEKLKPLTQEEKKSLSIMIRQLPGEYLMGVWKIVSPANQDSSVGLQFDIDTLPVAMARELEKYVKDHLNVSNNSKPSAQPKAPKSQTYFDYDYEREPRNPKVISEEPRIKEPAPVVDNKKDFESDDFISSIDDSDF